MRWLTLTLIASAGGAVLHFLLGWPWRMSVLLPFLFVAVNFGLAGLEELRKRSLNDAVWLTLRVISSGRDELKDYQEACAQVERLS